MIDPRVLIVRMGSDCTYVDAATGRKLDDGRARIASVIAEARPAGFFFILKDRAGRSGKLRHGLPKLERMTPIEALSMAFEIGSAAVGRFAESAVPMNFDVEVIDDIAEVSYDIPAVRP